MERNDPRAELAETDLEDAGARRDELEREFAEAYDSGGVVGPDDPWDYKVAAVGFEYSANVSIVLDGRTRDSGQLIRTEPESRRRIVRAIASIAAPGAGHWNNRGIAEAYVKWLDAAEKSFRKAIACEQPEIEVTRARSNLGRLDKLAAD